MNDSGVTTSDSADELFSRYFRPDVLTTTTTTTALSFVDQLSPTVVIVNTSSVSSARVFQIVAVTVAMAALVTNGFALFVMTYYHDVAKKTTQRLYLQSINTRLDCQLRTLDFHVIQNHRPFIPLLHRPHREMAFLSAFRVWCSFQFTNVRLSNKSGGHYH
jgi:hypothetical protein